MIQYALMDYWKIKDFVVTEYLEKYNKMYMDLWFDYVWTCDSRKAALFDSPDEVRELTKTWRCTCPCIVKFENGKKLPDDTPFGITVLGSGSRGNAAVIHGPEGNFLLDCGLPGNEIVKRLEQADIAPESIQAIVLTHTHCDHIRGCSVFAERYNIPIFLNLNYNQTFSFPDNSNTKYEKFADNRLFSLCGMAIDPFRLSHDASPTVGFIFYCHDKKIGFATDLGILTPQVRNRLRGCNLLVLESNYEPALLMESACPNRIRQRICGKHGHLSNDDVANALPDLLKTSTGTILLTHLSEEYNSPELAKKKVTDRLRELGREDIRCFTAQADYPTETLLV